MQLAHDLCSSFLIPSKQKAFSWSPSTRVLPLRRLHCSHTVCHKDGISVLGTDKSRQKEPYQEDIGDEEGFEIHIQSQQSWQLVTCRQGHCPARTEYPASVFLTSFLRFPGVVASIRLFVVWPSSR